MVTLATKLRYACVGHPAALIPWPHRLLHDAANEIDRLRAALEQAQSCILGDTLEGMTHEDARQDTLKKIRVALNA